MTPPFVQLEIFKSAWRTLFLAFALDLQAQPTVSVQMDVSNPGPEIPADFVGLSFEMQRVLADTNGWHFFNAENKNLVATFKTLGIKSLRVGGNTADRPTLPVPTESDVDHLFAFARAAELKVIYTLRLNQGELAAAVKMANYIARKYPKQLDCFAIGNEPNVFSTNFDVYIAEWKRCAAAITAPSNSPTAKFCGPSVSPGHEKWSARFANNLAASGLLKFISQHDYPGGDARKFATNAPAAREKILSPAMHANYAKFAQNFVPTVLSNGLAFRLEEVNSFYDGGVADASDTFASALWALDYQWWWAMHGLSGINFHTGDKVAARDENKPCRYATFWTTTNGFNIHPIGYAEKLFSLGSQGRRLPVRLTNTNQFNVSAYAVKADNRTILVTLINREHDSAPHAVNFILNFGATANASAQAIFLKSVNNEVRAKTGITLGAAEIKDDSTWTGKWNSLPPPKADGKLVMELPAASATVVMVRW